MREFEVVWSLRRGAIDPPEVLDDLGQYLANHRADHDYETDRFVLMRRATATFGNERDRPLSRHEVLGLLRRRATAHVKRALRGA